MNLHLMYYYVGYPVIYRFPLFCCFFIFLFSSTFFLFSKACPVTSSPAPPPNPSSNPLFLLRSTFPSRFPKSHFPFPILCNPLQSSPPNSCSPALRSLRPFFSFMILLGNRMKFSSSYCSTSLCRAVLYVF